MLKDFGENVARTDLSLAFTPVRIISGEISVQTAPQIKPGSRIVVN
jgi:hypothetical protein